MQRTTPQRGFTLIEMVMVIVIMGVIGAVLSLFMKTPIDAYFDTARRAALSDEADLALRRMARDIGKALPNSVRLPASDSACVEFMPTRTGGRFRQASDPTVAGNQAANVLDFSAVDTSFNMLGDNSALPADQRIAANDWVVVYNDGNPGFDAYNLDNTDIVSATPTVVAAHVSGGTSYGIETIITLQGRASAFPDPGGNARFHVVPASEQVVDYICVNAGTSAAGDGTGTLYRYARSLASAYPRPTTCPVPPAGTPIVAQQISACSFSYDVGLQRDALVRLGLKVSRSSETVSLYNEVHVGISP
jgi:MSHA biogenesis protein MshO